MTENALKCFFFFEKGTESKNTSSYILFYHFYAFGLSRNTFFCRKQRGNEEGCILDYVPLWAPRQFDWTKLAYCTSRSCIQQNKTSIKPLRHTLRKCVWTKSSCGALGSGLDQNCTCTTRLWGQQNMTINRSLAVFNYWGDKGTRYCLHTDGRTAGRRKGIA